MCIRGRRQIKILEQARELTEQERNWQDGP